jgi:hypothetical protein
MRPHEPGPWRTKTEATFIRLLIRDRGQAYADEWGEQILAQMRACGDLEPAPPEILN